MRGRNRFTLPPLRRVRPAWVVASVAAHVVVLGAIVASYGPWRTPAPEGSLRLLAAMPTMLQEVPMVLAAEPPPPPAVGQRQPLALPTSPELPPPGTQTAPAADTGTALPGVIGGVRGGRGLAGLQPIYGEGTDTRIWSARPMFVPEGGGRPIEMDSLVRGRLLVMAGMMDSLSRLDTLSLAADRRVRNPSWVVERNGRRYGIDQSGIHFGSFSIPSIVLAFLPLPQGNIDQARANQRLMEMRAEILRAAARAEAEDDFNQAVREIRARWAREREERRSREREQEQAQPQGENRPRP